MATIGRAFSGRCTHTEHPFVLVCSQSRKVTPWKAKVLLFLQTRFEKAVAMAMAVAVVVVGVFLETLGESMKKSRVRRQRCWEKPGPPR